MCLQPDVSITVIPSHVSVGFCVNVYHRAYVCPGSQSIIAASYQPTSSLWYRPRLLFQYLPYIQQEALSLDQQDVEAVLEATCGAGGDTNASSSLWGVCSSILKLVMWLAAQTLDVVCMTCASALLPVTVQMRCESRPAFSMPICVC